MDLRIFELPPVGTNAYLLLDKAKGEAVLFDAPLVVWKTVRPILEEAGCKLTALYLTHGHWDHMIDAGLIAAEGVPVHAHNGDLPMLTEPGPQSAFAMPGMEIPAVTPTHELAHGQKLEILGYEVEIRHVPGHSPGSVMFYFPAEHMAISGDALFAGSIGRTDFPGCSQEELFTSIREQIYTLPEDTVICPGHGPRTTVGREKTGNPFVRG